ncbi:hypothetical protein [Wolbachia endosymbiont (group B) of Rhopobota naevana]|nr:hypothetical protein [Wolbachia endosymbiont (group B) of Rhopobota naevana]
MKIMDQPPNPKEARQFSTLQIRRNAISFLGSRNLDKAIAKMSKKH